MPPPCDEEALNLRAHRAALGMLGALEARTSDPGVTVAELKAAADAYARLFALARMGIGLAAEPVPSGASTDEAAAFYPCSIGGRTYWRRAGDDEAAAGAPLPPNAAPENGEADPVSAPGENER